MTKTGYFRVAAAVPSVKVADVDFNIDSIINVCKSLDENNVQLAVFPELSVTGYTCGDLFHQSALLDKADEGVNRLIKFSESVDLTFIVGAPVRHEGALYNCAVAIAGGKKLAVIPKTYLPDYNEFYEKRWFSPADKEGMRNDTLIEIDGVKVGVEICEDLWTPLPPSTIQSLSGAQVMVNLSASNDIIGKYDYLINLIKRQSASCIGAYVYASAGYGESSTDLVFDWKAVIAENGSLLAVNRRWHREPSYVMADIDIDAINRDRLHIMSFNDCGRKVPGEIREFAVAHSPSHARVDETLMRTIHPHPFVPSEDHIIAERCEEIINIQVAALCKRLEATYTKSLTIGISGGLDSTLALLVAVKAFDVLAIPRKGIIGVTMPGFGTTDRTYTNAVALIETLGVTLKEIPIADAVKLHFRDIGHDINVHDVTYENSQARERTQILMDIANQSGGMVLGTGDLSELALGWATYNGDHMSMYGVNAGVPKTLVKYLVRWFAINASSEKERTTLLDIVDTPISPELTPADENGNIKQKTEDLVGPYELHDFFLYYTLRYGFSPKRIFFMANVAFKELYSAETIKHWMRTFYRRFFNQQFKRSCLPDGPKVGSVCLSPRGDWRMPSDASSAIWLAECDEL